jgi:hypothetical protein
MNASTLAAAFSNALTATTSKPTPLAATPQPAALAMTAQNMSTQKRTENRWMMNDDLLLNVLQQSLTPADQIMARRTLLKPAPWEQPQ